MKEYVKSKYLEFSNLEGSQHISGEFAILKILQLVDSFNIQTVFEIGLGIGTLPNTILNYFKRNIAYIGTEENAFCLDSLSSNLSTDLYNKLKIYSKVSEVLQEKYNFEMVIVDGRFDTFETIENHISKHAIIVIEGDRKDQERTIKKIFPKSKYVHIVSDQKNDARGIFDHEHWQGGVKVFFVRPTWTQYIYWFKEKIRAKQVYQKRKISTK